MGNGKFADDLSEALYGNDPDDSAGDSCTYGYWYGLYLVDGTEFIPGVEPGAYVLTEQESGFVEAIRYLTEEEAQDAFDALATGYEEYRAGREFEITRSTGRIGR